MEQREKEIQQLCSTVLNVMPEFYDNPNGGYENICPFCRSTAYGDSNNMFREMTDIKHKPTCAYLIAKDLSTNINSTH